MSDTSPGKSGPLESEIRKHFLEQAKACEKMGSPFTAALCRGLSMWLDRGTETGRRVLGWPGNPRDDALSLRLCGGLHRLVLSGADEALAAAYPPNALDEDQLCSAVSGAMLRHDAWLTDALQAPPQTNEIGRSAMLYPGLLTVARETGLPLALHEIGSSAGLNLLADRFHYRYDAVEAGAASSPVRLAPETRGKPIPLDGPLQVVSRIGSDIAPVDIGNADARLRLRSFVWADQTARLERLDAAIALAQAEPYAIEQADAEEFARRRLTDRPKDAAFVLFHSIMWQYMPEGRRTGIAAALAAAGSTAEAGAPIAWLRMEPFDTNAPHATLALTLWPGGQTRHLAHCDYHGRWIEWL